MILDEITHPVVLAPMAGGPSTPELTAAAAEGGGVGFLAGGYLSADALADRIARTRALSTAPFGVNIFVPGPPTPPEVYAHYLAELAATEPAGIGEPRYDDDAWEAKLDLLTADPVAVVSFTFGCPSHAQIARLRGVGSEVWVTVTSAAEALRAQSAGADVLVAQGAEAGGHRASFLDDGDPMALLPLLQVLRATVSTPLVASGGIASGAGLAAVLAAGARAAQLGSAFLRCPEAGTAAVHRDALAGDESTALTRAFTGRSARGIRNRFMTAHSATAPEAYPEIHYVTAPLRKAAREAGDASSVNLWAGQAYHVAPALPAAELVQALAADCRAALTDAARRAGH